MSITELTTYSGWANPRRYPAHERVWCACLRGTLWLKSKNKGRRCHICRTFGVPRLFISQPPRGR